MKKISKLLGFLHLSKVSFYFLTLLIFSSFSITFYLLLPNNVLVKNPINLQYIFGEIFAKTLRCQKAIPYLQQVLKKDDTYRNAESLLSQC